MGSKRLRQRLIVFDEQDVLLVRWHAIPALKVCAHRARQSRTPSCIAPSRNESRNELNVRADGGFIPARSRAPATVGPPQCFSAQRDRAQRVERPSSENPLYRGLFAGLAGLGCGFMPRSTSDPPHAPNETPAGLRAMAGHARRLAR